MNCMQKLGIGLVKAYKKFSPTIKNKCRYVPTCSSYMIGAITEFGFCKGTKIGFKRIVKCNHFSKGGYDPVPININGDYKWLF